MPTLTTYRYIFQPYAGPASRTRCLACGKPRCFTRYVDTETGELLPGEYGRCNREDSCGYDVSPYTRPAGGGLSYAAAAQQNKQPTAPARPLPSLTTAPAPAPPVFIPPDVLRGSLGAYERNALARLLRQHFGVTVADELLARFQVGTSGFWPGACVFWLVDEAGQVRGGQVVLLDETGHTVKKPRRCTSWVHTALGSAYRLRGTRPPPWLALYAADSNPKSPCLFGLPQLITAPASQPVAIVEGAKTAILATPYYPQFIWLATGSKGQLTAGRLEPLKGRKIVLFPDAGALTDWQARAGKLRELGFNISVSEAMENIAAEDASLAGGDLADVLLREWPGYPPDWDAPP